MDLLFADDVVGLVSLVLVWYLAGVATGWAARRFHHISRDNERIRGGRHV